MERTAPRAYEAVEALIDAVQLLGASDGLHEVIRSILDHLRNWTGCEAAGLRLADGDDHPYFETRGFPAEFVRLESGLCARDAEGRPVFDCTGSPVLDCMCGNVISGRFDPSQPFFTPGGSFWTNGTTALLASTTEEDRQARTRNRCNGEGYESVALIPMSWAGKNIGLLQLNDSRPGRFSLRTIETLEKIAGSIALTLVERRATEALRASEERLHYIVKHDPSAIAIYDTDMHYIAVSDRYLADYGVEDRYAPGKHHYEVFPEIPQKWRQVHRRVLQGAVESAVDEAFIRLDGSVTYNTWECRPWYRGDGSIGGLITYTEITTDRVLAEQAVRESEQRYRALFESMLEGSAYCRVIYDEAGNPVDWLHLAVNETMSRLPGFENAEGKRISEIIPNIAEVHPELVEALGRVASTGVAERLRVYFRPLDRTYDIGLSSPERGCFVSVFADISEESLAEEKLRQSQKMEAIGRLAGGIAHDFNNILTAIIGYCDIIMSQPDCDSASLLEDISEIRQSGVRAAELTRQILTFSRRQNLKLETVSLNDLIRQTEPLLRRTLGEDVDLQVELDDSIREIQVDRTQMMQVVMNLALNARDAMRGGGTLTLRTSMAPQDQVVLAVSDTGVGMTEEVRARIFEPFYTTKAEGEGTGLGLSMVYGIVTQSGGQIRVDSRPGKGTTFFIVFPPAPVRDGAAVCPAGSLPRGVPRVQTILVVEDEPRLRDLVSRLLAAEGYRTLVAEDAPSAMTLLSDPPEPIGLLLTDVVLPGALQGPDVARHARSLHPDLPVLFMSGYVKERSPLLELGKRTGFIEKPFSAEQLLRAIDAVLD